MKNIYLSGWISSNADEKQMEINKLAFHEKEAELIDEGYNVFNPARLKCDTYELYMYESFVMQSKCDATYFLRNSHKSYGSKMEKINAARLNHTILRDELTIESVAHMVSINEGVPVSDILGETRTRKIIDARHLVHALCVKLKLGSFAEIGRYTKRTHATVMHSVDVVNDVAELFKKLKTYEIK